MLILMFFFLVYIWLIVMFCLHALVVNTSEKMWVNFNVWVPYFPVWLVGKCEKILNLARYWKIEIKMLNEIL